MKAAQTRKDRFAQLRSNKSAANLRNIDPGKFPKVNTCRICCNFCTFLSVIPIGFICFYHVFPATMILVTCTWVLLTITPWLLHAGGVVNQDVSGPSLTVLLLVSVILSALMSVRCYYTHVQPMRNLLIAREYTGVYPQLPAISFPDAAYVEFVGGVKVDAAKAISFKTLDSGAATFCVAPVLNEANVGRVEFWAFGVDCCGQSGSFDCDDAADASTKTGWVLPQMDDELWKHVGIYVSPADVRRDVYVKAVKKAESKFQLTSPGEDAVFIRWTKKKKDDIIAREWGLIVVTGVFFAIGLGVLSLIMTRLYQRFSYIKKMHRQQHHFGADGEMANSEEQGLTQRLEQFLHDSLDGGTEVHDAVEEAHGAVGEVSRPKLSAWNMFFMGVLLPYLVMINCVILLSFVSCLRFGYFVDVGYYCLLTVFIMAWLVTPNRTVTGVYMILVSMSGSYIGWMNYRANMFHYCSVAGSRTYENMLADSDTQHYGDAGKITFDSSVRLRTDLSVGYLYEDVSYCAAPVISNNAPCSSTSSLLQDAHNVAEANLQQVEPSIVLGTPLNFMQHHSRHGHRAHRGHRNHRGRRSHGALTQQHERHSRTCSKPKPAKVEWWAIGADCCDPRGRFWCDGGEDDSARSAVVVRAFGDEDEYNHLVHDRQHFLQAINQSAAVHGLPFPENAVMLRWGKNADHLQGDWQRRAFGIVLVTGIASLVVLACIGIISHVYNKRVRSNEIKAQRAFDAQKGSSAGGVLDSNPSLAPDSGVLRPRDEQAGVNRDTMMESRLSALEE